MKNIASCGAAGILGDFVGGVFGLDFRAVCDAPLFVWDIGVSAGWHFGGDILLGLRQVV